MAKYILKRFSRGTKEAGEKAKEFLAKKGNKIANKIKKNQFVSDLAKITKKSVQDVRKGMDRGIDLGASINDSINSKAGNRGLSGYSGARSAAGYNVTPKTGNAGRLFGSKKFLKKLNKFGYDHGDYLTDNNKQRIIDWNKETIDLTHGEGLRQKYKK